MIIISQDKETIVNFENIIALHLEVGFWDEESCAINVVSATQANIDTLGIYPTKDRAMDVLQSIAKARSVNMYEYKMPKK